VSDQERDNNEKAEEASATVASEVVKPSAETASIKPGKASGTAPKKVSSGVAWLALLLVLVLAAGAAWVVREGQLRETALAQRVALLETGAGQKQANLDQLSERWDARLRTDLGNLESSLTDRTAAISQNLASVESQLAEQQKELARFSATDRESWLLAEVGHLLRLANQRLVMAGDPTAAQALLNSADAVLRELDDPALHAVRAAVASDVAALRAVSRVDVEGIYLQLAALIEQADKLVIFQFPEQDAPPPPAAAQDWQGRLQQGYQSALAKLSDYIIIRRRDVPMQALMDPQWEGLVRQNLRMLLEQAQVALLTQNQTLYAASLERARQWVAQFDDSDPVAAGAIETQIAELQGMAIEVPQPDISRSQRALNEAIKQREQNAGGEQ
jgi:uroporphyrin-3 C-methyltransferase